MHDLSTPEHKRNMPLSAGGTVLLAGGLACHALLLAGLFYDRYG